MKASEQSFPEILPGIFERSLSLENPERKKSRSLTLFERMADRLDEIAANTRGGLSIIATACQNTISGNKAKTNISGGELLWSAKSPLSKSDKVQFPQLSQARQSANVQEKSHNEDKIADRFVIAKTAHKEKTASIAKSTANNTEKIASVAQKPLEDASKLRSAQANNIAREKRQAEENANSIGETIRASIDRLGGFLKDNKRTAEFSADSKDAIGYALGGPVYGALKELKDAMPKFDKNKGDRAKERKQDSKEIAKAIEANPARRRDEKGRFIKPDQNEARRQIQQNEALQDQFDLEERETKKDAKRHKELVRAIKANQRDLLDKFLDRRASRGGRQVLREKTVIKEHDKSKPELGSKLKQTPHIEAGPAKGKDKTGAFRRAGSVAGGALAKSGAMLGGMVRMLPGIGQALALGMAAYEGFQGWNDKDLHKKAFGLQDGQEATTGQKASAAAASILDMGGLTSGLLEMFGIEFDKAGIARGLYEFGNNIATVATSFLDNAGPLLSKVWGGIGDLADKTLQGAQNVGGKIADFAVGIWERGGSLVSSIGAGIGEIGNSITNFATNIWNKGGELATQIEGWATSAIQEGAGILSGIWKNATDTVGAIWASLANFATNTLAKAGEMLSDLWKNVTELPGRIVDGAKDLAKGAIDTGSKLLSDGWNAVKGGFKSFFGGNNEAKAQEAVPSHGTNSQKMPTVGTETNVQPSPIAIQTPSAPQLPEIPQPEIRLP